MSSACHLLRVCLLALLRPPRPTSHITIFGFQLNLPHAPVGRSVGRSVGWQRLFHLDWYSRNNVGRSIMDAHERGGGSGGGRRAPPALNRIAVMSRVLQRKYAQIVETRSKNAYLGTLKTYVLRVPTLFTSLEATICSFLRRSLHTTQIRFRVGVVRQLSRHAPHGGGRNSKAIC